MGAAFSTIQEIIYWSVYIGLTYLGLQLFLSFVRSQQLSRKLSTVPKIPGGIPFFGHLFELLKPAPWNKISEWAGKYGPIAQFSFFNNHMVIIKDKEMLKQALNSSFMKFQKDMSTYQPFLCLLGSGLVTSEGELWKKQRSFISPAFRLEILEDVSTISKRATERLIQKLTQIKNADKQKGTNTPIEMGEEFRKLTLQVIGESVLSMTPEESNSVFPDLYLPIVEESNKIVWFPFRPFLPLPGTIKRYTAIRKLNSFVTDMIDKRYRDYRNGLEKGDVLDRILKGADNEKWNSTTVIQLRDEIKTFLFAGHETSSTMLTWTIYEVTKSDRILQKVLKEAEDMFGSDKWPSYDEIRKGLTYTTNCLKEALRKYSIVPIVTRELTEDFNFNGYHLPKHTKVAIPIQAVHHDPAIWHDPEEVLF